MLASCDTGEPSSLDGCFGGDDVTSVTSSHGMDGVRFLMSVADEDGTCSVIPSGGNGGEYVLCTAGDCESSSVTSSSDESRSYSLLDKAGDGDLSMVMSSCCGLEGHTLSCALISDDTISLTSSDEVRDVQSSISSRESACGAGEVFLGKDVAHSEV